MGEAEELAVKMIMQEGALRFQEQVIVALKQQDLYEAIKVVKAVEIDF
jgi:alpha-D-ribose 1-methylphosphonate 5-triphosphate synthase subunit PhnI